MLKVGIKKRILSFIIPPIGALLLKIIYFTCKVRFYGGEFPRENSIFVGWHGELMMTPFCYKKRQREDVKGYIVVSPHFDGQLIAKSLKIIANAKTIDGSTSKGGTRVLIKGIKVLKEPNTMLAISVDGPRGPRHSVAQGAAIISQRLHVPIVTINCKASSYWEFNSWDKMFLPKPFSKLDFFVGEPFLLDDLSIDEAREKIRKRLMENAHG